MKNIFLVLFATIFLAACGEENITDPVVFYDSGWRQYNVSMSVRCGIFQFEDAAENSPQEKINKIGSSMNSASANLSAFDKMEAKANKMLDEASAMAELNQGREEASVEDLMAKYDTPSSQNGQVEEELEKLKEKLGL